MWHRFREPTSNKHAAKTKFKIGFQIKRITLFDNEPMPQPEAIYTKLKGDYYFSKCDFSKGFWQIPMASKEKEKAASVTPDGCFQFQKMPFGMVNSTATFNRMMRKLLDNMQNAYSFVDDLLSHMQTCDKHMKVLREVFSRVSRTNLTLRPIKCKFGYTDLEFVGQTVSKGVVKPETDKIEQILNAPRPTTKTQFH